MGKQGIDERVSTDTTFTEVKWRGPYFGKTAFVQRADHIHAMVQLGLDVNRTADFRMVNFNYKMPGEIAVDKQEMELVRSALIKLLGGHTIAVSDIRESRSGTYEARIFIPCKNPPEGVSVLEFKNKKWLDVAEYLEGLRADGGIDLDKIDHDRSQWK
jgi:hypothetical protein